MTVYSTSKKLRVQRKDVVIRFVDGKYHYPLDEEKELFKILKTVSPRESIITDQYYEQINFEKEIVKVTKKSQKPKVSKAKGEKDGNSTRKRRRKISA